MPPEGATVTSKHLREKGYIMEMSSKQAAAPHLIDTDPELGMYDIRIFWFAALAAVLAVLMVAYFKMGY